MNKGTEIGTSRAERIEYVTERVFSYGELNCSIIWIHRFRRNGWSVMIIDIIGGGSLGLLYGGKLAAAGSRVRIWCRSREQAEQLRANGIRITEAGNPEMPGDSVHLQVDTIDQFASVWKQEPGEWAFLMTKQRDVEAVCSASIVKIVKDKPGVIPGLVCFQNGYGHLELLHQLLPEWNIYAAVTTEGAKRTSYHEVFHAGHGMTWIGDSEQDDHFSAGSRPLNLMGELQKAGFSTELSNDIDSRIFRKLLVNAVINPLTALWRIRNGDLLSSVRRVNLMKDLFTEGTAVYDACGISWEADLWDQILAVCRSTSGNTSSMLKDVMEGSPTEIMWINGSIVSMAKKAGIQAPVHELVTNLIEGLIVEEE